MYTGVLLWSAARGVYAMRVHVRRWKREGHRLFNNMPLQKAYRARVCMSSPTIRLHFAWSEKGLPLLKSQLVPEGSIPSHDTTNCPPPQMPLREKRETDRERDIDRQAEWEEGLKEMLHLPLMMLCMTCTAVAEVGMQWRWIGFPVI